MEWSVSPSSFFGPQNISLQGAKASTGSTLAERMIKDFEAMVAAIVSGKPEFVEKAYQVINAHMYAIIGDLYGSPSVNPNDVNTLLDAFMEYQKNPSWFTNLVNLGKTVSNFISNYPVFFQDCQDQTKAMQIVFETVNMLRPPDYKKEKADQLIENFTKLQNTEFGKENKTFLDNFLKNAKNIYSSSDQKQINEAWAKTYDDIQALGNIMCEKYL